MPAFTPQIGMRCQAKYSKDGIYYNAIVDKVENGRCLVRYVDFGNDKEWVPLNDIKR